LNTEADKPSMETDSKLAGISGWLVLPAIGLVASPIILVVGLVIGSALYSDVAATGFGGLYVVEMIIESGLVIFVIYAASRFFRKKQNAPLVIIILLVSAIAANGLVLLMELGLGAEDFIIVTGRMLLRSIISAAIWIPYFKISRRVKATFIN